MALMPATISTITYSKIAQSNLGRGRVATYCGIQTHSAARHNRLTVVHPGNTHDSWGPPHSPSRTAAQPFLHNTRSLPKDRRTERGRQLTSRLRAGRLLCCDVIAAAAAAVASSNAAVHGWRWLPPSLPPFLPCWRLHVHKRHSVAICLHSHETQPFGSITDRQCIGLLHSQLTQLSSSQSDSCTCR